MSSALRIFQIQWYGMVWYGVVWHGMVRYGVVWHGMVWDRQESLCERFFLKHENLQTMIFLPNKPSATYELKIKCRYNNYFCKTERFRKSFVPQIVSKLICN